MKSRSPLAILFTLALAFALGMALPSHRDAQARGLPGISSESIADVTARVLPSVVSIATKVEAASTQGMGMHPFLNPFGNGFGRPMPRRGLGSGVIVSSKGYILTNNHVVDGADTITVKLADGRETTAKVVGTDPKSDLAVLRLAKRINGLKPLPLGSSNALRLGEIVLAIGNPMGVGQSVTMGIVSAKGRANVGIVDYEDFIQTDAAINPGNSGGALVNMKGELVGINTAILSRSGGSQGIGFAIPSDMAKPIMEMLIRDGRVTRGYLGVSIQELNGELSNALGIQVPGGKGVLIADVVAGTPAKKAGLRRNDVVVAIDGKKAVETRRFRNLIAAKGSGTVVNLDLYRGGQRMQIPVRLGKLPNEKVAANVPAPKGEKAAFGVAVAPLTRTIRQRYSIPAEISGVIVTEVQPGSNAAGMGIREGDVIMEINRKEIRSARDFNQAYQASGRTLAVLLYRDGMTSYIVVTK